MAADAVDECLRAIAAQHRAFMKQAEDGLVGALRRENDLLAMQLGLSGAAPTKGDGAMLDVVPGAIAEGPPKGVAAAWDEPLPLPAAVAKPRGPRGLGRSSGAGTKSAPVLKRDSWRHQPSWLRMPWPLAADGGGAATEERQAPKLGRQSSPSTGTTAQEEPGEDDASSFGASDGEDVVTGWTTSVARQRRQSFLKDLYDSVPPQARNSFEVFNCPRYISAADLRRMCRGATGDHDIVISRPAGRPTEASFVVECSSPADKAMCRFLLDGLRLTIQADAALWVQELSPYECRAREIPKAECHDDINAFLMKHMSSMAILGLIGGSPALNLLKKATPPKKLLILGTALTSLLIQVLSAITWLWTAFELQGKSTSVQDDADSVLLAIVLAFSCMTSTSLALASPRMHLTTWGINPYVILAKDLFVTDDIPQLGKHLWRINTTSTIGYGFYAFTVITLAWLGKPGPLVWERSPALALLSTLGLLLMSSQGSSSSRRIMLATTFVRNGLRGVMRDTLCGNVDFRDLRNAFSKNWQSSARLARDCRNILMIALCSFFFWAAFLIALLHTTIERLVFQRRRSFEENFLLFGVLLASATCFYGFVYLLWFVGKLADTFEECLHVMERRYATRPFRSIDVLDVLHFFQYCSSPLITRRHPLGFSVGGFLVTRAVVARLIYLIGYASVIVVGRLFIAKVSDV